MFGISPKNAEQALAHERLVLTRRSKLVTLQGTAGTGKDPAGPGLRLSSAASTARST